MKFSVLGQGEANVIYKAPGSTFFRPLTHTGLCCTLFLVVLFLILFTNAKTTLNSWAL